MTEGTVHLRIEGGVASVVFDRPQARNAMTWAMYEQLVRICTELPTDSTLRVVTFRGAGGQAFVAGTDIEQFQAFQTGEDGVAYERKIDACISLLEALPIPTVAVIDGWTIGGGLAIATACDFRIATPLLALAYRSPRHSAIACRSPTWRASAPPSACKGSSACCSSPKYSTPMKHWPAAISGRSVNPPNWTPRASTSASA